MFVAGGWCGVIHPKLFHRWDGEGAQERGLWRAALSLTMLANSSCFLKSHAFFMSRPRGSLRVERSLLQENSMFHKHVIINIVVKSAKLHGTDLS